MDVNAIATEYARLHIADVSTADELAHDLAVDLASALSANADRSGFPDSLTAYVQRATAYRIDDMLRASYARRRREGTYEMERGALKSAWMDPAENLHLAGLAETIAETVYELSDARRETWLRIREDGASYETVAEERGVSKWTIKRQLADAQLRIRPKVNRYQDEEDR